LAKSNIAAGPRRHGAPGVSQASDGDDYLARDSMTAQIPHLAAMFTEVAHDDPETTLGWCDDQTEFEFGLDLILDGLDQLREPT
jgi:hypothetical protein